MSDASTISRAKPAHSVPIVDAGRASGDWRPLLALRVGIVGHREFPADDVAAIQAITARILGDIEKVVNELAGEPSARSIYAPAGPDFRFVSPLAEGADRIGAGVAVEHHWQLVAPLPFEQSVYETDFPGSLSQFRDLLSHARDAGQVVELDGSRTFSDRAYLAVGRFVIRNSDLMVAIWDGEPSRGLGGTADIVSEARENGVPVIHISSGAPHSVRFLSGEDMRDASDYSVPLLSENLRPTLLPDFDPRVQRAAIDYFEVEDTIPTSEAGGPSASTARRTTARLGTVYPAMMRLLGYRRSPPGPDAATDVVLPPADGAMHRHYVRADKLATHYANVHRSVFVLIYILSAAAVSTAAAAIFFDLEPAEGGFRARLFTIFELICLAAVFLLVVSERRRRWRERWLDYRLLAEILRETSLLHRVGFALPQQMLEELALDYKGQAWVPWLVGDLGRAARTMGVRYDRSYLEQVRDHAASRRLLDQIRYHQDARARNRGVNHRLRTWSEVLFFATLAVVVTELLAPEIAHLIGAGFLAALFPAMATASFGIRNQAEFEIVGRRSERTQAKLERQRERIAGLAGQRLDSEALGREMLRASEIMLYDTAGWAAIFAVKETETL